LPRAQLSDWLRLLPTGKFVECVEDNSPGPVAGLRLHHFKLEKRVVGVGGEDEARDVPDQADASHHPGDPVKLRLQGIISAIEAIKHRPLSGTLPLRMSSPPWRVPMKPQALVVQNSTLGTPNAQLISPPTTQVMGGNPGDRPNRAISSRKWTTKSLLRETAKSLMYCMPSRPDRGRPSGIASTRKPSTPAKPSKGSGAPELSRRWLLYWVMTKLMRNPLEWRSLARWSMGFMWPGVGQGTMTAWGFAMAVDGVAAFSGPKNHRKG
ncbi:hypothetical protein Taro_040286, partial [Colocasia esculenta]|nr:hypothetical protein [Colocasia esculenta]